ncbi:VWA domain-containing protein [Bacillus salacetis]|uniref:VWA domain-containing protein n=1 Tax=Bacillus salacetis TaxID=2315464 RepID=A0A3A1QPM9_9BACI|nr:VWA domain-containing protein [Bacillus salacetis]RIW29029.1 VWA domain-containing protein [Bacillus salacetis]
MKKKCFVLYAVLLSIFLVTACSENEPISAGKTKAEGDAETGQSKQEKQGEKDIKELIESLPKPSETSVEIVNAKAGPFSGKEYDELTAEQQKAAVDELGKLPKIEGTPTEDEIELYWRTALSLFHEDYPNPAEVLDELEVASFGGPENKDPRYEFKENLNVEILLDASGSMAKEIDGKSMMDIAKGSIEDFAEELPEGANIALRVYGHKGSGADEDKELSCSSNELIYDMNVYDSGKLQSALNNIQPAGWTPLAETIEEAKVDLGKYNGQNNTNIIYLVSDGVETCGGDPITQAKSLADSDIQPIVNVIGFDLDPEGQKQLEEVAQAGDGIYSNARSQSELKEELEKAKDIAKKWEEWKNDSISDASGQRYDQKLKNIPSFGIDWGQANRYEKFNIREPLYELREQGHISREAYKLLSDKTSERFSRNLEINDEIREELRSLADENFETVKTEIEKKYKENVNSN